MPSPDMTNNQPIIATPQNGSEYWEDRFLQNTFEKPEPPREEVGNTQTRSRVQTGEEGGTFCQDYAEVKKFSAQWGKYWVQRFSVTKTRSGWFWLGVAVAVTGAIVLTVVTAGAFAGAAAAASATAAGTTFAGTAFVTAGGSLTAAAAVSGGLGAAAVGGGGAIVAANKESDKTRGGPLGPGFYQDIQIGNERLIGTEERVIRNWYPC